MQTKDIISHPAIRPHHWTVHHTLRTMHISSFVTFLIIISFVVYGLVSFMTLSSAVDPESRVVSVTAQVGDINPGPLSPSGSKPDQPKPEMPGLPYQPPVPGEIPPGVSIPEPTPDEPRTPSGEELQGFIKLEIAIAESYKTITATNSLLANIIVHNYSDAARTVVIRYRISHETGKQTIESADTVTTEPGTATFDKIFYTSKTSNPGQYTIEVLQGYFTDIPDDSASFTLLAFVPPNEEVSITQSFKNFLITIETLLLLLFLAIIAIILEYRRIKHLTVYIRERRAQQLQAVQN